MTELDARGAAIRAGDRSRPRAVLPALCITQITSWGIVYYAFPVLNPAITADTGWSTGATTAAFSAALLISAFAGIRVGRIIDRRGPRTVMTAGSTLAVASLLIVAAAPNLPVFFSGWLLAGFAMAATFYQPAFAALTRWWAPDHVQVLTIVTLAGGLASTVFAPLTAALADHLSWRTTYVVLALVLAAVTIPAHALALKAPWPKAPSTTAPSGSAATVSRSRPFWMLAIALTLSAFTVYAVVVALVPLMIERGCTTSQAAWALGLGGAGQTLGRTLYAPLARRTGATARTTALIALGGVTTAALALVPGPYPLHHSTGRHPGLKSIQGEGFRRAAYPQPELRSGCSARTLERGGALAEIERQERGARSCPHSGILAGSLSASRFRGHSCVRVDLGGSFCFGGGRCAVSTNSCS
ncbi:MFS transporter [Streptomyces yanii]|uniref:MFS transporter n=1 Tax=Streptomyces yanii TaxID=78510 RepID=A0ABV5R293_9ACTN